MIYRIKSVIFISLFVALNCLTFPSTAANSASEYRRLGLLYRQQGRYQEAIDAMSKSVELEPSNTMGKVNLGWTLHLAGKGKEATNYLWQAIYQAPLQHSAYNALGIVYLVNDNLINAVLIHSLAVMLKPDNEIAYYNLSLALHQLKMYQMAIAAGQYAFKLEPNNPHPLVSMAMNYWDSGSQNLARNIYQQAIKLDARYRNSIFLNHLQQAAFTQEQINTTKQILSSL